MNNEKKLEREGKLCQICEGDYITCSYGDEYRKTMKCQYFKDDLNKIFKPRFEIKYGRFGAYFYDNKLGMDLDLNDILIALRKLTLYEEKGEERNDNYN